MPISNNPQSTQAPNLDHRLYTQLSLGSMRSTVPASLGYGEAIGHHGELLQGIFEDENARLHRGLTSLPCRDLKSTATFKASNEDGVTVTPVCCEKSKRAAELALARFARIRVGGHLTIASNIPVARGMGSSTADVLASISAVLDYLHVEATPDRVMEIAVRAETACDSTLFSQQAVLFAHREGIVIESFRTSLPAFDFISVDAAPDQSVDTLVFEPARYDSFEVELFRPLRSLMRRAIRDADLGLLGRVATASALINQRFLPKPRLDEIQAIGTRHGAVGVQVAHSGTVVGLLFDPASARTTKHMDLAMHDLRKSGFEPSIFRNRMTFGATIG
ncbi:GHMP kinase [Bradyrhizobium sp. B124]|uniref:GHMP family kinase ATP-binding protein n=1 Tax=Bradyrhizobium sp. B124 TaxID=3140245 RepID=UPI003183E7D2